MKIVVIDNYQSMGHIVGVSIKNILGGPYWNDHIEAEMRKYSPDAFLIDPKLDLGREEYTVKVVKKIKAVFPGTPIVVMSVHPERVSDELRTIVTEVVDKFQLRTADQLREVAGLK